MFRSFVRWWTDSRPQTNKNESSNSLTPPEAEEPPRKRKRHTDVGIHTRTGYWVKSFQMDGSFWFPDGDVTIGALSDTEGAVIIFRCHKWHLVKSSPIFMDLFALPQPMNIEQFQGTPLVYLPDKQEDFREILRMIYDPNHLLCQKYDNDLGRKIAGPLRLTDKYEMDDLRARLVALLQGVWSATLDGWDKKEADLEHLHPGAWFTSAKNATRLFPAPISVMRLADELRIPSILPAVLYELNRTYLHKVCNAEPRDARGPSWHSEPSQTDITCRPEIEHYTVTEETRLSAPELHRLIVGREFIRSRTIWLMTVHMEGGTVGDYYYHRTRSCKPGLKRWWADETRKEMERQVVFTDPLKVFLELAEKIMYGSRNAICEQCRRDFRLMLEGCRETIWKDLNNCFSVNDKA